MAGQFDPNTAQNLLEIEKQFAVKAVEQAQTYWNLLEKVAPKDLKLTKLDDEIYEHALKEFPELSENEYAGLTKIDEDWLKSEDGKNRWRNFINQYEKKVTDFNFGCLIRTDARGEYGETNTIFVTRMQFYAFEACISSPPSHYQTNRIVQIARNRLGLNDKAHEMAKEEAAKEAAKKAKEASKKKTNGKK